MKAGTEISLHRSARPQKEQETAVIFNPSAGQGKAIRKRKKVEACLKAQKIPYRLFVTQSEKHLVETAAYAVERYPVIIGAGGDTTVTIIANQILRAKRNNTLGIISLGSVNDLAREIGVLKIEQACSAIKMGRSVEIDVGMILSPYHREPSFFLVQASLGLGVTVNRYVDGWMRKHSYMSRFMKLSQPLAAMGAISHSYRNKTVPLTLDVKQEGANNNVSSPFVVFSNTSVCGGDFRLSPFASPVDGKLDCCVIKAPTFPHFLDAMFRVRRQTHLENDRVEIYRDRSFRVRGPQTMEIQLDGEIFKTGGEFEISTLPRALKLIVNPDFLDQKTVS